MPMRHLKISRKVGLTTITLELLLNLSVSLEDVGTNICVTEQVLITEV